MSEKIIVVGGVAGGATALARLRRLDEEAQLLLLERGGFVSFANCGLPYYIGGSIASREALFVSNIASIEGKYHVEIRNFSEVIKIEKENKRVLVLNHRDGSSYYENYDALLLSTGSHPFVPDIEGKEAHNVFTLWNIPDTDRIFGFIKEKKPKKAVIAGGGFIGLEMAENLQEKGIQVTVVELAEQILPPFDRDMAKLVQNHLQQKGVEILLGKSVEAIDDGGRTLRLQDGSRIETDMTLLSIGVRPNSLLAKEAGLACNARGGIIVDEGMQTSDPHIYAVGDVIEVRNKVSGIKTMIPLAGPANKQGRAVAARILGRKEESYEGSIGTGIAKIFDLTAASTGENEKALQARGLRLWKDYGISLLHPMSHASYYPKALPMTIKLLFAIPEGKVLGAQIIGFDGVDKRIDTIATSIHFGGTVYDLSKLELAYAPPYSSAKDPVNMAGYMATDILEGLTEPITWAEYEKEAEKYLVLDVREEAEVQSGALEKSLHIPLTKLRERLGELDKDTNYLSCCAVGLRGYIAERILKQKGYKVRTLAGGMKTWRDLHFTEEKGELHLQQDKLPEKIQDAKKVHSLDTCGLCCPGPIVQVAKKMQDLSAGEQLEVCASDPGFLADIESWCAGTGNTLIEKGGKQGIYTAKLRKGGALGTTESEKSPEKTMIVFDGDLDKVLAAFIIANGSLAMGNKVNMFFTFWGLNALRKPERVKVNKDLISKIFGLMLPKGAAKLGLSKMHFGGLGTKMMKRVMKEKGVSSLEELMQQAMEAGVRLIACQMSMDVMGIRKEELIEGVEIGGVASMLHDNDKSNMNLFI